MPPKLGILAGGGNLPAQIVQACRDSGRDFFVLAFEGQAEKGAFDDIPHAWVRLGAAGKSIEYLRQAGCKELVMAGGVRRPSFSSLRPDKWLTLFVAKYGVQHLGDGNLLKALVKSLEENEGFRVVGADTLLPGLLAKEGLYGSVEPDWQAEQDIQSGIEAALDLGRRDLGQGAVVQLGQVLDVEDENGTDALLKRARKLRLDGPGGVLVKIKKPGQEHRVDLPTIGVSTIEGALNAGLRGIAIEAGGGLIFDREAVIEAADKAGLFVIGVKISRKAEDKKQAEAAEGDSNSNPLIYLIAGEPSGDALGSRLMASLKKRTKNQISFAGVGGTRMEEQGLKSLFPMADLSVMGAAEVLPKIPRILMRIMETTAAIERIRPTAVVTIDSPDFCFRVAKRLKGKGIPLIHYVAPTVWAWRPGRAKKIAGFLDHLLALLPFEPPYFKSEGLATTFVGHPVVESDAGKGDGPGFRDRCGFSDDDVVISALLGSRLGEVTRLSPVFAECLFLLKKKHPNLRVVVPTTDTVASTVRRLTGGWPVPSLVVEGDPEKYDAFAASNIALAASGTVALELAMARTPAVITYRINPISAFFIRRLAKVRFVHLVNVILDREAIPEFLQESCRADFLAAALEDLLMDEDRRDKQISAYGEALDKLGPTGASPASKASKAVLDVIAGNRAKD